MLQWVLAKLVKQTYHIVAWRPSIAESDSGCYRNGQLCERPRKATQEPSAWRKASTFSGRGATVGVVDDTQCQGLYN